MKTKEYIKLVQASGVFESLSKELQQRVLNATGEERTSYAAIIIQTLDFMNKAKEDFVARNKEIENDCTFQIKRITRKKVVSDEGRSREKDDKASENLLGQLNKI